MEWSISRCHRELERWEKLLITLRTDTRATFLDSHLNPMVDYIAEDEGKLLQILKDYRAKRGSITENEF
ncbi:MAG: hypothetical protein K0S10_680 [Rubrobacteraceae bacterium]|nr:hypothetical protein [Rubrobacteraceae bacterium]